MKKIFAFIFVIALASCSAADDRPANEWQPPVDYEITDTITVHGTRLSFEFLEQLMGPSYLWSMNGNHLGDLSARTAVIGEFTDVAETWFTYEYSEHFGKDVVSSAFARAPFLVTEVLYGDLEAGDVIYIEQRYAFEEERGVLISFTELAPMHKGDRWIYFINGARGLYTPVGEADSRFPIPNEEIMRLMGELTELMNARDMILRTAERAETADLDEIWNYGRDREGNLYRLNESVTGEINDIRLKEWELLRNADTSAFGLLDCRTFNYSVYAEIIEYFGLKAQNWRNPGRDFDAKLIALREACECC